MTESSAGGLGAVPAGVEGICVGEPMSPGNVY